MAQHLKLIALLIFTLSASYTSAQSLRKLLERPYGIIESKWEKDAQGATELNYYNEDYCDYYLYRANDRSYNLSNGKNTIFKGSSSNLVVISFLFQLSSSFLILLKVVDMFAF